MARYTADSRDRVREAIDFVELVCTRTELRRAGARSYEGLCPFHDERSPSFSVEPVEKVYYCFGCQASGDLFTFVQETEGVDFKGALELLADRAGIELEVEAEDPREAQRRARRERLQELLARTTAYYERCLWDSSEAGPARAYLAERNLSEEILHRFRVGYSPSAWDRVLLASRRQGFSERELYDAGLAQRSQQERGRVYDRFRARIMFPLADMRGRVLGFGARALREDSKGGGSGGWGPKYLNSTDNELYHKGRHLYGADLARAAAAKAGEAILCEGYTDVIAMHQAGFENAVGLMGTALTTEQVGELGRMAQTVLLALDADSAGQEAMLKAARLAAQRKLDLRVVELPAGADPADLLQREGAEAMRALVAASVPFVRFRVERTLAVGDDASPEGRDRMLDELRPVFAQVPQSAMRMELTRLVSGKLGLAEGLTEKLLSEKAQVPPGGQGERSRAVEPRPSPSEGRSGGSLGLSVLSRRDDTERAFLAQCIAAPAHGQAVLAEVEIEELFSSKLLRRAARHLLDSHLREPLRGVPEEDRELVALLAELIVEAGRWPAAEGTGTPPMLEVQQLQLQLAAIDRRIHSARAQGTGEVSALARRRGEVKLRFDRAQERALARTGGEGGG